MLLELSQEVEKQRTEDKKLMSFLKHLALNRSAESVVPSGCHTKSRLLVVALLLGTSSWIPVCYAQPPPQSELIEIFPARLSLYMIAGGGANIGVSVGPEGFIVVDTGSAAMADKVLVVFDWLAQRHKTTVQGTDVRPRIRYIFNTSAHPDQTLAETRSSP